MTNGAYGSRSHGGHKSNMDDTVRGGRWMDTPHKRGSGYGIYSSLDQRHNMVIIATILIGSVRSSTF